MRKTDKPSTSKWTPSSLVTRSEVRPNLAAILRHTEKGNQVRVGSSEKSAYSAFVSCEEFKRKRRSFAGELGEIDVEEFRRNWPREREHVENTGSALRILRKGVPVAIFCPTTRAFEKKVARTIETVNKSRIERRVAGLESRIAALKERTLDEKDVKEFRQAMGLMRELLKEWRKTQGLPGTPNPSGN
jgi:PHD/YefM family antitoxin component YafN of YafNO toxin-antitoxin module